MWFAPGCCSSLARGGTGVAAQLYLPALELQVFDNVNASHLSPLCHAPLPHARRPLKANSPSSGTLAGAAPGFLAGIPRSLILWRVVWADAFRTRHTGSVGTCRSFMRRRCGRQTPPSTFEGRGLPWHELKSRHVQDDDAARLLSCTDSPSCDLVARAVLVKDQNPH